MKDPTGAAEGRDIEGSGAAAERETRSVPLRHHRSGPDRGRRGADEPHGPDRGRSPEGQDLGATRLRNARPLGAELGSDGRIGIGRDGRGRVAAGSRRRAGGDHGGRPEPELGPDEGTGELSRGARGSPRTMRSRAKPGPPAWYLSPQVPSRSGSPRASPLARAATRGPSGRSGLDRGDSVRVTLVVERCTDESASLRRRNSLTEAPLRLCRHPSPRADPAGCPSAASLLIAPTERPEGAGRPVRPGRDPGRSRRRSPGRSAAAG